MKLIVLALIGLSAGITIGSAVAAFLTLLDFIPRVVQITKTKKFIKIYQHSFTLGAVIFSFLYFSNFSVRLNRIFGVLASLIIGMFIGLFSSALAEVLNVIPVFAKKFKIKHKLGFIIFSLLIGKTLGSLFYWLIYIKR
ncbi:stage V sporulation protein AB [Schnuerera sp. xch1]|uniref:stage V sporulation protein AB n=1 Tax=Schnuerera sp. xch1 TaxID=2874283 RepID=UPI001CBD8E0A|nr:stage V sporulation protein AB [Schnuerera sp. xch1]MBZ2173635.1 stage V sporulation protein AB [Schnuerera sp. xch1]